MRRSGVTKRPPTPVSSRGSRCGSVRLTKVKLLGLSQRVALKKREMTCEKAIDGRRVLFGRQPGLKIHLVAACLDAQLKIAVGYEDRLPKERRASRPQRAGPSAASSC